MKFFSLLLIVIFFMPESWGQSHADWAGLNERIKELERQQSDYIFQTEARETKVASFLKTNLTLGGFFEPAFIILSGEDTHTQASNARNLLGLNLAAEFTPRIKFVSQFITGLTYSFENIHNDPNAPSAGLPVTREYKAVNFGSALTQGYVLYFFDEHYSLMGGLGYVPFGYYAQQREPVLFIRREGPQILRTSNLISPLFNGFNLQSRFEKGSSSWGFNIYTFNPRENLKRPGVGERIWWKTPDEAFTTGLSLQSAKVESKIENVLGADLRIVLNRFIFTTEYARHMTKGEDTWSYFFEPSIFLYNEDILAYVFFDYANNPSNKTGTGNNAILDPITLIEYGTGINWLPTSYTRFRIGFIFHNYDEHSTNAQTQQRDYISLDLSAGVAF